LLYPDAQTVADDVVVPHEHATDRAS
jgi:hypothetical protein